MFGELANDLMQGDGEIVALKDAVIDPDYLHYGVTAYGLPDDDYDELVFYIPERSNLEELFNDADDYMEGNGGSDLMYGGLGQDDMIGGSSALFGLDDANAALLGFTAEQLRPDASDVIYGGAGNPVRVARNDFVGLTDTDTGSDAATVAVPMDDDPMIEEADRHSLDADFIMGDNANVYRLVGTEDYDGDGTSTFGFLEFNYDQTSDFEDRGDIRIIPRAMQQLDYTLGGGDYDGGSYNDDGQATPTGERGGQRPCRPDLRRVRR